MRARRGQGESGQAAVEAALTLPMTVFLILGTLQLSLMLQARVLAHYAAFRSTRAGSVNFGDCEKMTDAAVAALLPAYTSFLSPTQPGLTPGDKMAQAWAARAAGANRNQYAGAADYGYNGPVVWIFREQPLSAQINGPQDTEFDEPGRPFAPATPSRLEVRLVFWYPMHIPFANWVMAVMFQTYFSMSAMPVYNASDPLMPVKANANWSGSGASLQAAIAAEVSSRFGMQQYVFPIEATYTMRMMTPAKASKFTTQDCPPAP